jgi:very-short-patch-repair endonuclease
VDIRQTRRCNADDLAEVAGPPRSRCETAAVRGALWARSDKQAALILSMAVQQRLVTVERLGAELLRVKRDKRRMFLNLVMLDLLGGARSLGEIDFARECRRRDLPEPGRQVLRKGPDGRSYLDVLWEAWGLAVEVDGAQHHWAENLVAEALRHNDVTLTGCRVLRLPLIGLRVAPDDFFGQIESALRASGWARPA